MTENEIVLINWFGVVFAVWISLVFAVAYTSTTDEILTMYGDAPILMQVFGVFCLPFVMVVKFAIELVKFAAEFI